MKKIIKNHWTALSDAVQFALNMGLRYTRFRLWYAFQRRTGILKYRFPVSSDQGTLITLTDWQNLPVHFFFRDRPAISSQPLNQLDYRSLAKRVKAFQNNQILFFCSTWYKVDGWVTNPETGFQYDKSKHWTEIADFSAEAGDIKFVWEKSRFTFLYDLIRYDYHFDKDQSEAVFAAIKSWIQDNPVNCGPNWQCSQEITLRVLNWTFALQYYQKSPALTQSLFDHITGSIHDQMRHVAGNIHFSRIAVRNNHALTETLGLYLVGLLYPFFEESADWKRNGKKWFEKEIAYQVYEDGTFLQFSMNYHRVAIQLLSWAIQLAHLNNESWDAVVYDRAKKSLRFLYACQDHRSGKLPNYGNNDGALFFPLSDCHFRDYRPQLLALANVLGEALDYGAGPWEEERWWLGIPGQKESRQLRHGNEVKTYVFPHGGYYVLQDKSSRTFLRCGSYQNRPFQSDHLHLDIWINGENILRDAGSFKYNTEKKWTDYFSGTASHNTIMLDAYDQMRRGPRFIWYDWITKSHGYWKTGDDKLVFEGWFEGFKQLGENIMHRRRVTKTENVFHWIVEDWIENAPANIAMQQLWHPAENFFEKFYIRSFLKSGKEIPLLKTEGWYAPSYGCKKQAHRIVFSTDERYIRTEIGFKPQRKMKDAHIIDTSVFS